MEIPPINRHFLDRPHGDNVYINALYQQEERLQATRGADRVLEQERRRLLSETQALLANLDQPMQVVVAGGFNAGKSSFINALLARPIMPMAVNRTTATINRLVSGTQREWIVYKKPLIPGSAPPAPQRRSYTNDEALCQKIRETMAHDSARIERIDIVCPDLAFLAQFTLVDTPGLDHNEADSALSRREIERADALIWVAHAEGLRKEEIETIRAYRTANPESPIIVIVNYIDILEEDEIESVLRTVRHKLADQIQDVFPFSAKLALAGQRERNEWKIQQSRLYALKEFLYGHLFANYHKLHKSRLNRRVKSLLERIDGFFQLNQQRREAAEREQIEARKRREEEAAKRRAEREAANAKRSSEEAQKQKAKSTKTKEQEEDTKFGIRLITGLVVGGIFGWWIGGFWMAIIESLSLGLLFAAFGLIKGGIILLLSPFLWALVAYVGELFKMPEWLSYIFTFILYMLLVILFVVYFDKEKS